MAHDSGPVANVIFDLGNVLIPWDPRPLYRTIFNGDESAVSHFLSVVCPPEWNLSLDEGHPWDRAIADRVALFPDFSVQIRAYDARWEEMLGPPIAGSVAILEELVGKGIPVFALSNWSADKFKIARAKFSFLSLFQDLVVSGEVKLVKPDPAIYRLLLSRNTLSASSCIFIDDVPANIEAGERLGIRGIRFTDPDSLRRTLSELAVL